MSDPFDTDPDDLLESEDQPGKQAEDRYDTEPERPAVDIPQAPEPGNGGEDASAVDFGDVDPELTTLFWKLVLAIKFALLTLALGALFVLFDENPTIGGQLLALGALLSGYVVYRYRETKARLDAGEFDSDGPTGGSDP